MEKGVCGGLTQKELNCLLCELLGIFVASPRITRQPFPPVLVCITAGWQEGPCPPPVSGCYHWVRAARPNVLAWQLSTNCSYQCLYHSNTTNRFWRETASTPCPGSAQAMSAFPFYPAKVPGDSSSTWAAIFVGWSQHVGGDGDAAEGGCSKCMPSSFRQLWGLPVPAG